MLQQIFSHQKREEREEKKQESKVRIHLWFRRQAGPDAEQQMKISTAATLALYRDRGGACALLIKWRKGYPTPNSSATFRSTMNLINIFIFFDLFLGWPNLRFLAIIRAYRCYKQIPHLIMSYLHLIWYVLTTLSSHKLTWNACHNRLFGSCSSLFLSPLTEYSFCFHRNF